MSSTWSASEGELAAIVQRASWRMRPSSPLFRLTQVQAAATVRDPDPDQLAVLRRVAGPRLELGLSLSPPAATEPLWFFLGEDGGWAGHFVDRLGHHRFATVTREDVSRALRHTLALDQNTPGGSAQLSLDPAGLKTLVALLDCNREWTLESLLQRVPRPQRVFTLADLLASFLRGWNWGDRRWLTGALQAVCPKMAALTAPEADHGMSSLTRAGLAESVKEGWLLTPEGQNLAARSSAPVSYAGLRAHLPERGRTHHVAAILGTAGSLWLEFEGDRITLSEPSSRELAQALESRLQSWIEEAGQAPEPEEPSNRNCPQCARALKADARFCSYCGASLPASACPACQAAVLPDACFCSKCGWDLRAARSPAPPPAGRPPAPSPGKPAGPARAPAPAPPPVPPPALGCPASPPDRDTPAAPPAVPGARAVAPPPDPSPEILPYLESLFSAAPRPAQCPGCKHPLREGHAYCTSCGLLVR